MVPFVITQKLGGGVDEGGGADGETDVMPEEDGEERVRGTEGVEGSAIGGAGDAVREGSVLGAVESETIGGETRSPKKITVTWGVDVYFAYDNTLNSMGKEI